MDEASKVGHPTDDDPDPLQSHGLSGEQLRLKQAPSATFLDSLSSVPFLGFLDGVAEAVRAADHAIELAQPPTP